MNLKQQITEWEKQIHFIQVKHTQNNEDMRQEWIT